MRLLFALELCRRVEGSRHAAVGHMRWSRALSWPAPSPSAQSMVSPATSLLEKATQAWTATRNASIPASFNLVQFHAACGMRAMFVSSIAAQRIGGESGAHVDSSVAFFGAATTLGAVSDEVTVGDQIVVKSARRKPVRRLLP